MSIEDDRLLAALKAQPTGLWAGPEWTSNPEVFARSASMLSPLVVYGIPFRDGDAFSKGGAKNAAEYHAFIYALAKGVVPNALVIIEPDALAHVDFLSPEAFKTRMILLSEAVSTFVNKGARVYLDAGDSNWIPAAVMATRLRSAGIAKAAGVSLNVAHTEWLANEVVYLQRLRAILGARVHGVIDCSRNGVGSHPEWCNPPGRALGARPTMKAGIEGVDALLYVKPPGTSDGPCNGGPKAGAFWREYALGLAKKAVPSL